MCASGPLGFAGGRGCLVPVFEVLVQYADCARVRRVFPCQYCVDNPQKSCQNIPPPLCNRMELLGRMFFLHGYVTVYVPYYHFSLVVPYYDAVAVLDVDALLSCPLHILGYEVFNISA